MLEATLHRVADAEIIRSVTPRRRCSRIRSFSFLKTKPPVFRTVHQREAHSGLFTARANARIYRRGLLKPVRL